MAHPATPTPDDVSLGIEVLDLALTEAALPPEVAVALQPLLGNMEAAAEVLDAESARPGGLGYPEAAGILHSILDNRARVLGKLGRDLGRPRQQS